MGRVNTPVLSESQRTELENCLKIGKQYAFRKRCQVILLKADGRKSKDVGLIVGMSHISVNTWLSRYKQLGIYGLQTKPGRGRKPLLNKEVDSKAIVLAVKANRQRLQTAKAEWEAQSGKSVSRETLRKFLKSLAEDISE